MNPMSDEQDPKGDASVDVDALLKRVDMYRNAMAKAQESYTRSTNMTVEMMAELTELAKEQESVSRQQLKALLTKHILRFKAHNEAHGKAMSALLEGKTDEQP